MIAVGLVGVGRRDAPAILAPAATTVRSEPSRPAGALTTLAILAGYPGGEGHRDDWRTNARFTQPQAVAADGAGHLFVADRDDTVRDVDLATGNVTTLAGEPNRKGHEDGTGAAAHFDGPNALACDGAGSVYVADTGNGAIRQIVAATGLVTTIADGFHSPVGLASGGAGHLFVSDWTAAGDSALYEIDFGRRTLTPVVTGLPGRMALAWGGGGRLFVAADENRTVDEITVATGAVRVVAGMAGVDGSADGVGAAARFSDPAALVYDGAGRLFVSDAWGKSIRVVDVDTGTVATLVARAAPTIGAGAGTSAAPGPAPMQADGLALDRDGNLFVADGRSAVWKISGTVGGPSTASDVVTPLLKGHLHDA